MTVWTASVSPTQLGAVTRSAALENVETVRRAAQRGDAEAQYQLGVLHVLGRGVPQDDDEALRWFRRAAVRGSAPSQNALGRMYSEGRGVVRDAAEAARFYRVAAERGDASAQFNLAALLWNGRGVTRDDARALRSLRRAAGQGLPSARDWLRDHEEGTPGPISDTAGLARALETSPAAPLAPSSGEASSLARTPRYRALVIGNAGYRSLPPLQTAVRDAESVAALLADDYGFEVTLLTDATRESTLQALDALRAELNEADSLLLYYAGHGWLDPDADRGYWLPVDASSGSRVQWLSNATVTDSLRAIRARHVLVVADSCYSGSLARADERGIRRLAPGAEPPPEIAALLQLRSRTVLASGGLEPVTDRQGGAHSVFAAAFLEALRDADAFIDGRAVFTRVRQQVSLAADQTPQYEPIRRAGHEVGGDFVFARTQ